MNKFYSLLKIFNKLHSSRLKYLGILGLYMLKKRYICLSVDPTCACNLKCRMCYFNAENEANKNTADNILEFAYIYASPGHLWHDDFDYGRETFEDYCRKTHYARALFGEIIPFMRKKSLTAYQAQTDDYVTKPLNYNVK